MSNNNNNVDVYEVSGLETDVERLATPPQPLLGTLTLVLAVTLSLYAISLFEVETFSSWVTFFVVICVPMQIVLGMVWKLEYPHFLKNLGQPAKGIVLCFLMLMMAAAAAGVIFYLHAHGQKPTPFTLMYVIFCVLTVFWFVLVWGCWPLPLLSKNPAVLGVGTLIVGYLGGLGLFNLLFNFAAQQGAPFYSVLMDPAGLFPAFEVLAFSVTTVAVIFSCALFDFWPITAVKALRDQPIFGVVSSIWVLFLSALIYGVCVLWAGMEPIKFMLHISIGLLFGCLVPLVMFEGQLFSQFEQPVKGILQLLLAVLSAVFLPRIFWALAPVVSGPLVSGAPGYQFEFWLASALLAMTFPIMVITGQFFNFWPFRITK